MTDQFNAFIVSLDNDGPPTFATPLLCAVWHGLRGSWESAHELAQAHDDDEGGAWVHAWLHRIEGDLDNAAYWYQRARRQTSGDETRVEGLKIAESLIRSIAGH